MTFPGTALLLDALTFAAHKHRDQRRKDPNATPYINHPIALAHLLWHEAQVEEPLVLTAAILHDTVEDTKTTPEELEERFGKEVRDVVMQVTDDKTLPKAERKAKQITKAPNLTRAAKLVKLADKTCNLRDIKQSPPADWPLERRREYFEWAKQVVAGLRGTHARLEELFDQAYQGKP